jgi:hypothetical protein
VVAILGKKNKPLRKQSSTARLNQLEKELEMKPMESRDVMRESEAQGEADDTI